MAGEFEQLLPFMWRGQHLPVTRIHLSLAHDLVEHKYWGVDGGRVEATGIAPVRISATIPLSNHIFPGKKEKWSAGDLYPTALRAFIVGFGKRQTGLLQHPELGEIACKAERLDFELSGDKQGATEITASWVETLDDDVLSAIVESPVRDIELGASNLDANMTELGTLAPTLPTFQTSLSDLARKLSGIADSVTVLSYRSAGAINNIIYQANRIQFAVDRAKSALTWQSTQQLNLIKAAAYDLRRAILSPNGIGLYTVRGDSTLAGVVVALPKGTKVGDVIKMNPDLVRGPVVAQGTVVRYPLAA
jgi:hypothetical protein